MLSKNDGPAELLPTAHAVSATVWPHRELRSLLNHVSQLTVAKRQVNSLKHATCYHSPATRHRRRRRQRQRGTLRVRRVGHTRLGSRIDLRSASGCTEILSFLCHRHERIHQPPCSTRRWPTSQEYSHCSRPADPFASRRCVRPRQVVGHAAIQHIVAVVAVQNVADTGTQQRVITTAHGIEP